MTTAPTQPAVWINACPTHRLGPADGAAVLMPDGRQVALFRTLDDEYYAVDNIDPFTHAAVISRGIVGDRGGEPTVASPMLKNVFSLRTGQSLDDEAVQLTTWPVRVHESTIQINTRAEQGTP
ncbi:nitrite reductase small subunit NirD [Nocardiopsis sp. YSL2]|uniref:nitrite reductase small subunit NirD n=1 Tax=Nocardiopsis sp. YSL2 TaxID=2939492 RepID=UPI0026F41C8E|nr:nitrite reductase small subunit NirD [Nocardiopsis sp. YSL2]